MSETQKDRIVALLGDGQSPFRDELVAMTVDHALRQKLATFLDFEAGRAIVVRALTKENLGRILLRHAHPGFERYSRRVADSKETLGDLVPEPARERIRTIVAKAKPRAAWAEGMIDPALLRKLFAPVWANLLGSFAKRLPIPGVAAVTAAASTGSSVGSGIASMLTRSVQERAEKLVDRGRSAMGGIGAEVEKRIQAAAREFSDGAAEIFKEALSARLKSKEGQKLVAEIREQILAHSMKTTLAALHEDAKHTDVPEILTASAEIIGQSVTRDFILAVIDEEVAAFVASEGDRTLAEVLGELGMLEEVRRTAILQLGTVARGLFAGPAFADWVGRLLNA